MPDPDAPRFDIPCPSPRESYPTSPRYSTSSRPHSRSPFATAVICCKKALPSSSGLIFSICCSFSITPLSVEVPTQSQPYLESGTQMSSRITPELQSIASTRDDQTSIESHFIAIPPAGSYTDPLSPPRSATPPLRKHGQSKPISEDASTSIHLLRSNMADRNPHQSCLRRPR